MKIVSACLGESTTVLGGRDGEWLCPHLLRTVGGKRNVRCMALKISCTSFDPTHDDVKHRAGSLSPAADHTVNYPDAAAAEDRTHERCLGEMRE